MTSVVSATCTYPGSGDWVILDSEDCTLSSTTLEVYGNLNISGNLTINDSTLTMHLANDGDISVYLKAGGSGLWMTDGSVLTSNGTKHYKFYVETADADGINTFSIVDSFISYAGASGSTGIYFMGGVQDIDKDIDIDLINSSITNTYTLLFEGIDVEGILINNSVFQLDNYMGFTQYSRNVNSRVLNSEFNIGSGNGISFYRSRDILIEGNTFKNGTGTSGYYLISIDNGPGLENITIRNNVFANSSQNAIRIGRYARDIHIEDNTIYNIDNAGLIFTDTTALSNGIYVDNNTMYDIGTYGVYTTVSLNTAAQNYIFTNNNFSNCGNYGYYFLQYPYNLSITGTNLVDGINTFYLTDITGTADNYYEIGGWSSNIVEDYSETTNGAIFNIINSEYVYLNNITTQHGKSGINLINSNNIILNNSFTNHSKNDSSYDHHGVYLDQCNNCSIYNTETYEHDYGFYLYNATDLYVKNVTSSINRDEFILERVYNSYFEDIDLSGHYGLGGFYIHSTAENLEIHNVDLTGASSTSTAGIILTPDSASTTITNITFYNVEVQGTRAALKVGSTTDVVFYDSIFNASTISGVYKDVYFGDVGGTVNVTFYNVVVNDSDIGWSQPANQNSTLTIYTNANITAYSDGDPLNTVSIYINGSYENKTQETDVNGNTIFSFLTHIINESSETNYFNYDIELSKEGYTTETDSFSLETFIEKQYNITLPTFVVASTYSDRNVRTYIITDNKTISNLRKKDKLKLSLNNTVYTLKLESITSTALEFYISELAEYVTIYDNKKVDINDDNISDLIIKIIEYAGSSFTIKTYLPENVVNEELTLDEENDSNEDNLLDDLINETINNNDQETINNDDNKNNITEKANEITNEQNSNINKKLIIPIIIGISLIVAIVLYLFFKKRK